MMRGDEKPAEQGDDSEEFDKKEEYRQHVAAAAKQPFVESHEWFEDVGKQAGYAERQQRAADCFEQPVGADKRGDGDQDAHHAVEREWS